MNPSELAFPVKELNHVTGDIAVQHFGMSLRDYFAAKALAALIAEPNWNPDGSGVAIFVAFTNDLQITGAARYAAAAYRVADAMMAARES